MAIVATALFVVTACDKKDEDDNGNESGTIVELTAPPYKDVAKILNITQNNAEGIKQLRMMESGAYMIARDAEASSIRTRGASDLLYEFGKYTYNDGKYVFDNGMTISFAQSGNDVEVTITWKNGTSIKTTGAIDSSGAVTAGVFTENLCSRPWKIERKAWYEKKFGTLKDQFDANTIIEGIYFDSKGLFAINYQNRKDDVGVWRWTNMNDGKLIYNWNDKLNAISLFTGNASVTFEKNPESCKMILAGLVNNIDFEFAFYMK